MITCANRFDLANQIIDFVKTRPNDVGQMRNHLENRGEDDVIEIWDALRKILYSEKKFKDSDQIMRIRHRNNKKNADGTVAVSAFNTYLNEIIEWAGQANKCDHIELVCRYNEKHVKMIQNLNAGDVSPNSNVIHDEADYDTMSDDDSADIEEFKESCRKTSAEKNEWVDNMAAKAKVQDVQMYKAILGMQFDYGVATKKHARHYKEIKSILPKIGENAEKIDHLGKKVDAMDSKFQAVSKIVFQEKDKAENLDSKVTNMGKLIEKSNDTAKIFMEKLAKDLEKVKIQYTDADGNPQALTETIINDLIGKQLQSFKAGNFKTFNTERKRAVWGSDASQGNFHRFYTFVVSKIPNESQYTAEWLKEALNLGFESKLDASVQTVELLPSNFQNSRTKSFKITVKLENLEQAKDLVNLSNPAIWIAGTKVTRYRRARKNTNVKRQNMGQNFEAMGTSHQIYVSKWTPRT